MQRPFRLPVLSIALLLTPLSLPGQQHGRKYKAPPPTASVVITVEKAFNGKPLPNASVIFHAVREGKDDGNLETKTDPDGKASIDLLEVGSHVTVQVIANGFATYAGEFDLSGEGKQLDVRLLRPRTQVSAYNDGTDTPAQVQPGIQEHAKPGATAPTPVSPTRPLVTTPPADTPATVPSTSAPTAPTNGSPQ